MSNSELATDEPSFRSNSFFNSTIYSVKESFFNHQEVLPNQPESVSFLKTAFSWQGSISPKVILRVLLTGCYATLIFILESFIPRIGIPITPFEYLGVFIALILVMRVNAGYDRWWEGRKVWGNIVNHSRNLALIIHGYASNQSDYKILLKWIAAWPFVIRQSLMNERNLTEVSEFLGTEETEAIKNSEHMPMYVAIKISSLLDSMRKNGLDPFCFLRADTEKSNIIDAIGASERIRGTGIPLVLAIKTRRFITIFLFLLPFGLIDRLGVITPLIVALASYPLFCLDEIGAELQNPFSPSNISHLPLKIICNNIKNNILSLAK